MSQPITDSGAVGCTKSVYVVGQLIDRPEYWQLVGIFENEADAVLACRTPQCFYSLIPFNKDTGNVTEGFPNPVWPVAPHSPEDSQ